MPNDDTNTQIISISKSYHDAVETYINYFVKLTVTAFIPTAITAALLFAIAGTVTYSASVISEANDLYSLNNGFSWTALLLILLAIFVQLVGVIALTYMAVHHERVNIGTAFKKSPEYIGRFILLMFAIMGIVVLGILLGYLLLTFVGVLIGALSLELINPVYDWLNIIPIIIAAVGTTAVVFAPYSIVDRDHGTRAAMKHSFRLVRHSFWPIAIRVLLIYAIIEIVTYALQFVPVIGTLLSLLILTPFTVVYLHTLYKNLNSVHST